MFSSNENNKLTVINIDSLATAELADINKTANVKADFLSTILLFHTKQECYVLSEISFDEQGQINTALGGKIHSINRNQLFKDALTASIKRQIGYTTDIEKHSTNTQSLKIIKKLFTIIDNQKSWGKQVCINTTINASITTCHITAIKHLDCKYENLKIITSAINTISPSNKKKSEFIFLPLDSAIALSTATSTNPKLNKKQLSLEILEMKANGICNDFMLAALAEQGAFDTINASEQNNHSNAISLVEQHTMNMPIEMLMCIFSLMDDKSILFFLQSSKTLSSLLNAGNIIWEQLMLPRLDKETRNSIPDKDYLSIWRKRTTVKVDFSNMFTVTGHNISNNSLINLYTIGRQKFSTIINTPYIYNKSVDPNKINHFIKEDNAIELFKEASRLGEMLEAILNNDIEQAQVKLININSTLKSDITITHSNYINVSDYNFLFRLMPYILDVHATSCFELFTKTCCLAPETFSDLYSRNQFIEKGYPILTDIIFNSNKPYFICKFVELAFTYSNNTAFMKAIIQTCVEKNAIDLLMQGLNKIDFSIEKYSQLIADEAICEILKIDNATIQWINHKKEYAQATSNYFNLQGNIQQALFDNTKSSAEMLEMFMSSHDLAMEVVTTKANLEACNHANQTTLENVASEPPTFKR